jgi:hypothetical protein
MVLNMEDSELFKFYLTLSKELKNMNCDEDDSW